MESTVGSLVLTALPPPAGFPFGTYDEPCDDGKTRHTFCSDGTYMYATNYTVDTQHYACNAACEGDAVYSKTKMGTFSVVEGLITLRAVPVENNQAGWKEPDMWTKAHSVQVTAMEVLSPTTIKTVSGNVVITRDASEGVVASITPMMK